MAALGRGVSNVCAIGIEHLREGSVAHQVGRFGLLSPRNPAGSSGAQEIAKSVPGGAQVVKAFDTIFRHVLAIGA